MSIGRLGYWLQVVGLGYAVIFCTPAAADGLSAGELLTLPGTSSNALIVPTEADLELAQAETVTITAVELVSSEQGANLILQAEAPLAASFSTEGNDLLIEVPNAQLQGADRTQLSPTVGIAAMSVRAIAPNRLQIRVTGIETAPTGQILSSEAGLTLGITPIASIATPIRIIVTAEKQPDTVQGIPISITALTEEDIEDADITSFEQIARATPNFTTYTPGRNFLLYSVRGLSNFNFLSRDPVAFYIDDVPYDYTGFLDLQLTDLERVEVLRGPQSTLYGRNAEAGVVNVVTRRPTNTPEYRLSAALGNFSTPDLHGSVSGPLVEDELFFRLSGNFSRRDGFTTNTLTGEDIDFEAGGGGRMQLRWMPSEAWEILLNASIDSYRDGTPPISRPDLGQSPSETTINAIGFNNLDTHSPKQVTRCL